MKLTDSTKGLHVSVYLKFQTSETLLISVTGSQSQNHIWGAKNAKKSFFFNFYFLFKRIFLYLLLHYSNDIWTIRTMYKKLNNHKEAVCDCVFLFLYI